MCEIAELIILVYSEISKMTSSLKFLMQPGIFLTKCPQEANLTPTSKGKIRKSCHKAILSQRSAKNTKIQHMQCLRSHFTIRYPVRKPEMIKLQV